MRLVWIRTRRNVWKLYWNTQEVARIVKSKRGCELVVFGEASVHGLSSVVRAKSYGRAWVKRDIERFEHQLSLMGSA